MLDVDSRFLAPSELQRIGTDQFGRLTPRDYGSPAAFQREIMTSDLSLMIAWSTRYYMCSYRPRQSARPPPPCNYNRDQRGMIEALSVLKTSDSVEFFPTGVWPPS